MYWQNQRLTQYKKVLTSSWEYLANSWEMPLKMVLQALQRTVRSPRSDFPCPMTKAMDRTRAPRISFMFSKWHESTDDLQSDQVPFCMTGLSVQWTFRQKRLFEGLYLFMAMYRLSLSVTLLEVEVWRLFAHSSKVFTNELDVIIWIGDEWVDLIHLIVDNSFACQVGNSINFITQLGVDMWKNICRSAFKLF